MKNNIEEQAAIFRTLADPTRLRLLKLLYDQHEPDALCVNALVGLLGVSQPAISQHLRVLKSAGLVKGEKRGYFVHYAVNQEALKHCRTLLEDAFTIGKQGQDDPCENCETKSK